MREETRCAPACVGPWNVDILFRRRSLLAKEIFGRAHDGSVTRRCAAPKDEFEAPVSTAAGSLRARRGRPGLGEKRSERFICVRVLKVLVPRRGRLLLPFHWRNSAMPTRI